MPQVGANASSQVTKISSLGLWVPVHNEEWDGDLPLNLDQPKRTHQLPEEGEVVFQGGKLPWRTGKYEVSDFGLWRRSPREEHR